MSTATLAEPIDGVGQQQATYRTMSGLAIAGLAFGVFSSTLLWAAEASLQSCVALAWVPVLGVFFSLRANSRIRSEPDVLSGRPVALAGLAMSLLFLVWGMGRASYVYATEVPTDHARISFFDIKPDQLEERGGKLIPDDIAALDGKKVFIKGYMRPGSAKSNLSSFLLVRDNQECCYGPLNQVKYYDQLRVELADNLKADYSTGVFKVGGVLSILPENLRPGSTQPVFRIVAHHLK